MKKLFLLFLLFGSIVNAQNDYGDADYAITDIDPYIAQFGIKFGLGLSHLTYNAQGYSDLDYKMKFGVLFGTVTGFRIKKDVMFQGELLYVSKGASYDSDINVYDYKLILRYLEFPLLLKYYPENKNNIKPYVCGGPVFSILFSSTIKAREGEADISSAFSMADYGIGVGAGVDFLQKKNIVVFDIRFTLGFNNIYNSDGSDIVMKNSNLAISTVIIID